MRITSQPAPQLRGGRALRAAVELGFAPVAAGVIVRRPTAMSLLERLQADTVALSRTRRLRREFGRGPVELVLPGRRLLVILDADDVGRVLEESPAPFTPANREKQAALRPFQPHGVLISQGPIRKLRRDANVAALDTAQPLHHLAEPMRAVIADEADELTATAHHSGVLSADELSASWWKIVRRVTFGDAARDDTTTTDLLHSLRAAGNWSYLTPSRPRRRERFIERLYTYPSQPEPDTLIAALAEAPTAAAVDPIGQIPHWLFAFDAAGIAMTRALALLASHPAQLHQARVDVAASEATNHTYDYLRNCVLESLRLWPTTPAILRDTTAPTEWRDGAYTVDAGAAVLIAAATFHRDPDRGDYADRFDPDIWSDGRAAARPDLVPFSAGPAQCPGQNLVLFATSTLLAELITRTQFTLTSRPRLSPTAPLPATFNNFGVTLATQQRWPPKDRV